MVTLDWSIDNALLSDFLGVNCFLSDCALIISTVWLFAEDFNHLSLQMGNMEHKQEQMKLAVKALLLGKYVMAVQPTSFGKTIICESVVFGVTKIKRLLIVVFIPHCSITEDQISMVGCLQEEREFVKGNDFKQVLGHYFCRTSSVF